MTRPKRSPLGSNIEGVYAPFQEPGLRNMVRFGLACLSLIPMLAFCAEGERRKPATQPPASKNICALEDADGTSYIARIDKSGKQSAQPVSLGTALATNKPNTEYVVLREKLTIAVRPARLQPVDFCSQSTCTSWKKITPSCSGVSTFHVTISVIPSNFGPGRFQIEPGFIFDDPASDFGPDQPHYLFPPTLSGNLLMPWLDVVHDAETKNAATNFLSGKQSTLRLRIRNEGNLSTTLREWIVLDDTDRHSFRLHDISCNGTKLNPQESCEIEIRNSAQLVYFPVIFNAAVNDTQREDYPVVLLLTARHPGEISLGIKH